MEPLEGEPTFDKAQLRSYFDHIKLPQKYRSDDVPLDLAFLTALHRYQIAAVPYENLSLHYSQEKTTNLDPQALYNKFVTNGRNRGGYCMEGSLFFLHILRSLGFDAYPTVVRIRLREDGIPQGEYIGIVHIVLIIELSSGDKYTCDAAFGGDGPTVPLPLKDGVATRNLGTQEIRLVHERIPGSRKHKFWVYQYRNSPQKPWNSFYAFNETEFLDIDFRPVNYWTSQGPTFQKTTVIIVKFLLGEAGAETGEHEIVGKIMLVNGTVKRNMGGKTETLQICETEDERIKALKKWFDMDFTDEEVAGIKGMVTELRSVEVLDA